VPSDLLEPHAQLQRCAWQSLNCLLWPPACLPPLLRCPAGQGPAVPQQCPETGSGFTMGGPFWAEPIHDAAWVAGLLDQVRRDRNK
jgi:tRNA G26 N,N-dimethylase Trm1